MPVIITQTQRGAAIGIAGNAHVSGIPAGSTLQWLGASGDTRMITVFNSIDKGIDADTTVSTGNNAEWLSERKRNERIEVHVECKPVATTMALAQAIMADPPKRLATVTCTASVDGQLTADVSHGTLWLVNSKVDCRYTPDGDAVMAFDLVARLNDDGSYIVPAALSDS